MLECLHRGILHSAFQTRAVSREAVKRTAKAGTSLVSAKQNLRDKKLQEKFFGTGQTSKLVLLASGSDWSSRLIQWIPCRLAFKWQPSVIERLHGM